METQMSKNKVQKTKEEIIKEFNSKRTQVDLNEYFTIKELEQSFGMSQGYLFQRRKKGMDPRCEVIDGSYYYHKDVIDKFVEENPIIKRGAKPKT